MIGFRGVGELGPVEAWQLPLSSGSADLTANLWTIPDLFPSSDGVGVEEWLQGHKSLVFIAVGTIVFLALVSRR